jgi:DNA-binding NtrC family response regulator/tetratricopeptide (TPR) repeat protein
MAQQLDAYSLYKAGHFARALKLLEGNAAHRTPSTDEQVLRAALLSSTGKGTKEAIVLGERLLKQKANTPAQRCRLLDTLGSCYFRIGHHRQGAQHYRDGITLADQELLTAEECRLRLNLFHKQIHWLGPQHAAAGVSQLRRKVHHVSERILSVRFQSGLAELAAKLGLLSRARHHLDIAKTLLPEVEDKSVHSQVMLTDIALAAHEANPGEATELAFRLAVIAEEVGDDSIQFGVYGNLAHLLALQARYEEALEWLHKSLRDRQFGGGVEIPLRDTLMQIHLWRGSLAEASAQADIVHALLADSDDSDSFYGLWHMWTRVKWLYRIGDAKGGVALALDSIPRIERMADRNLLERMKLLAAEGLGRTSRIMDACTVMAEAVNANNDPPLEAIAEACRLAGRLTASHDAAASTAHFGRARRILESAGNISASREVELDVVEALEERLAANEVSQAVGSATAFEQPPCSLAAMTERLAVVLDIGLHAPLLANETMSLLLDTGTIEAGTVTEVFRDGTERLVRMFPDSRQSAERSTNSVRIQIGLPTNRLFEIDVIPYSTPSARATVLAIERLVHAATVISRARQDQREQAAFWPDDSAEQQLGLVCTSERMLDVVKTIHRVAKTHLTVLITGETGVGKELFARALHIASPRKDRTFLPFNCSTVPRDMLDSQLFGHRKGAFTGAHETGVGVIRAADGGTLFLDEIGEMTMEAQPKLLRFLESGEIHPLGEAKPAHVDVRIVAATNANLEQLVSDGRFREDLFYRLNVLPIHIPPLRERREEVPALVEHFVEKFGREMQKPMMRVADETLEYLLLYRWPGNVRQLANEIRRMVALAEPGAMLSPAHLSVEIISSRRTIPVEPSQVVMRLDQPLADATEQLERAAIERALTAADGNNDQAARLLGLSRKGLYLKRQRLGLK